MTYHRLFPWRARAAMRERTAAPLKVVTFAIGAQEYGMPVADVVEIVPIPALVTVAGAPPHVIGLLNRRGSYLPVLYGCVLVGEPPHYDVDCSVIVAGQTTFGGQSSTALFGLLVDQVNTVRVYPAHRRGALSRDTAAPFLSSVVSEGDQSVVLFDLAALRTLLPPVASYKTHA